MALEPVFEKIIYNGEEKEVSERIKTECKADVVSEDVKRIINVCSYARAEECSIEDGGITCSGRVNFFVCYENAEGSVCKKECVSEFSQLLKVEGLQENAKANVSVYVDKTEVDLSGIKLLLTAYVSVKAQIKEIKEINALSGGEDIITDKSEVSFTKSLGIKDSSYSIDEEFDIDAQIKEILNHSAEAAITSVQCGVGCVIVDGEVYLSLTMLKDDEVVKIIKQDKTFPFRTEIDCEEAMPSNSATASVAVKSFKTDISVDAENNTSVARANITLSFNGEAFEEKTQSVAIDAFSLYEDIKIEKSECYAECDCAIRSATVKICGKSNIEQVDEKASLVAVTGERFEIVSKQATQEGVVVTGVFAANVMFIGEDGRLFSRKAETPIEVKTDITLDCGTTFKVKCVPHGGTATMISFTEIELCGELSLMIYPIEKRKICVINDVISMGQKQTEDCAISVYIATEGESLWQLSKRLNVCPDELAKSNKELQFPLCGSERIVIYRQK